MSTDPSEKPLSPWWRHAVILVMAFGFSVLTMVTVLTYTNAPPIPERVTDAAGATLFTREDVEHGQEVFLKYGLMEHGTLWGHGAYLGPDYSAEYLHRLAEIARDTLARERHGRPYAELDPDAAAGLDAASTACSRRTATTPPPATLRFSPAEAAAWKTQEAEWAEYFSGTTPAPGLPAKYIRDAGELEDLNSYFAWAAWATVANRPGKDYSYTNNWPYEPAVGNRPSSSTYLWSALSLVTLLGGPGRRPLRRRPLRLPRLARHLGERARARQRARALDADAEPEGGRPLLRRRRAALPAPGPRRGRPRPLPRRVGRLLRLRPRAVLPLQPAADLPPPARHLLDRHRLGGGRPLPRADRRRRRAPRAAGGRPRAARGPRRRRLRQPRRRVAGHQRPPGRPLVLVRPPGLGVPGPRPLLAAAAGGRPRGLARPHVPGPAPGDPRSPAVRAHLALPLRGGGDPALLPARALLRPPHQLRRDRQLALLDHPPVGGGLLRALRHRARRRDVRGPGAGHGAHRHPRHLPRRHPLPDRRDRRDRAPLVLHRPGDAQHGPGRVLLRAGGGPADPPHARRLGLHPPARRGGARTARRPSPTATAGPSTS